MTTQMTFGSLFAGVGGFDLGFEAAGIKCLFQVEWDKHCQQTLQHHWPLVPKWGDVSTVNGAELPPVDVITFGSPCQDLSTAGKRAGLEGSRSGLFFEATRIIKEMRDATDGLFPRVAVWENVSGAFSSNEGYDFGSVLDGLANVGALGIEWALLDARWFGVPQRRRRIFVVAEFDPARASRGGEPLLAVGQGSARDLATRKKQEQNATGEIVPCLRSGGGNAVAYDATHDGVMRVYNDESPTLTQRMGTGGNQVPLTTSAFLGIDNSEIQVRRLTPVECERLMGWPDNHTLYRADGKVNADSTRYKMCGNGVASPVAEWVGRQIIAGEPA